jgi:hypothetical protein
VKFLEEKNQAISGRYFKGKKLQMKIIQIPNMFALLSWRWISCFQDKNSLVLFFHSLAEVDTSKPLQSFRKTPICRHLWFTFPVLLSWRVYIQGSIGFFPQVTFRAGVHNVLIWMSAALFNPYILAMNPHLFRLLFYCTLVICQRFKWTAKFLHMKMIKSSLKLSCQF